MSDGKGDLFGKIDALLEKRGPDALLDKGLEREDFPVLTDVVAADAERGEGERRQRERRQAWRRQLDRDAAAPENGCGNPASMLEGSADAAFEHLMAAVERRLVGLLAGQQAQFEATLRRLIREELDRR